MNTIETYNRKRDFYIINSLGECAGPRATIVDEICNLRTQPHSAYVTLAGVPAVVDAKENELVAKVHKTATMTVIDGMPIVKIGRRKGFICDRCAAPDIMGPIFTKSIELGKGHFFYGCTDEVLDKLKVNLEKNYHGIKIVGAYSPPYRQLTEEEDNNICLMITKAHPDFLWVGLGAPKQDIWMYNHYQKIDGCVMLGVGAGFNFFAETLSKAPVWMENYGIEWLYRLLKEPKRLWRRYIIGGFKFIYYRIITKLNKEWGFILK